MKGLKHHFKIADLIVGFLKGRLSIEEHEELRRWIEESEEHQELWKRLTNAEYLEEKLKQWKESDFEKLHLPLREEISVKRNLTGKWIRSGLKYAAVLVVALSIALGIRYFVQGTKDQPVEIVKTVKEDSVLPLGRVARLVLGNGKEVNLNDELEETILEEGGVKVHTGKSLLHYSAQSGNHSREVVYNTLIVPRGGEYQVTLSDGTKVWLNAASSLRYPTGFQGRERKVVLSGEAYFEVTPDKQHPFLIEAGTSNVQVLGTKFNYRTYPDDPVATIALAEGQVMVNQNEPGGVSKLLKPGYGAMIARGKGDIQIHKVNLEAELAWITGMFIFDNESLGSIMTRLSRWYDVDITYENGVDTLFHFTGRIQKYENISAILHLIELTEKVRFEVEGRVVKVKLYK